MTEQNDDVIDKFQAAQLLDLNYRTVTNKASRGEIPGWQRTGLKQWFFSRKALEEWKQQQSSEDQQ